MPSENCFRLDDNECPFPVLTGSGQGNPEEAIEFPEPRPPTLSVRYSELLAEREVLECQLKAEPQGGRNQREQPQDHKDHAWEVSGREVQVVNRINATVSTRPERRRKTSQDGPEQAALFVSVLILLRDLNQGNAGVSVQRQGYPARWNRMSADHFLAAWSEALEDSDVTIRRCRNGQGS
jgi:hypothetical protein